MRVFRMEYENGKGVYNGEHHCPAQELSGAHPFPEADSLFIESLYAYKSISGDNRDLHRFCFNSLSQFKRWFYNLDWLYWAEGAKVSLNEYEVSPNRVIVGTTQCTFLKGEAEFIKSYAPVDAYHLA